jgi:TonB family protein
MALSSAKKHSAAIGASLAFHGLMVLGLTAAAYRAIAVRPPAAPERQVELGEPADGVLVVQLPAAGEGVSFEEQRPEPVGEPPRPMRGNTTAHPDSTAAGQGGDLRARVRALNLADLDEHMRLSPDLLDRLDQDQLQRLRVARTRASFEDRRATTHPAELTLVAVGSGTVLERRERAVREPSRGALASAVPNQLGGAIGFPADPVSGGRLVGGQSPGPVQTAPGEGLLNGEPGIDHRIAAPVASARPAVTAGLVAVAANERALARDNLESDQEIATIVRSIVHASTAGGLVGDGQGGTGGGGDPGAGGWQHAGLASRPLGLGEGDVFDYWTTDPRLVPYFRQIHAKIDPLWADAFPKSALLELRQGTVILEFTISADGRTVVVSWPPVRPSGVDEFDRNCASAIRRGAPFPPIPRVLGVASLRIRAPFVASNPVIK